MDTLEGRVAVVTGGASGIGRGMAEAFAARGAKLVLADVEAPALEAATKALQESGAKAIGVECDVSQAASVQALRDRTLSEYGAVHVVCNNAGVAGSSGKPIWEESDDEWDWVMGVNFQGVLHGIRAFVPAILEQGGPGHVVNTASLAGLMHGAGIYGVSKHAVVALSESLWGQLKGLGAPCSASVLCPGWVRTRIIESERNRPESPRPDPGPEAPGAELIRKMVEGFIEKGLDPREVGERVADAILEERFYVLPHPSWNNMIENRMRTILEGRDPVGVRPEGASAEEWFPQTD